jgi:hypothetical protein
MDIMYPRCAGRDVHKDRVVAGARIVTANGVEQHVETFGTTTSALLALSDWLTAYGVTHVAMEATGIYWRPVKATSTWSSRTRCTSNGCPSRIRPRPQQHPAVGPSRREQRVLGALHRRSSRRLRRIRPSQCH